MQYVLELLKKETKGSLVLENEPMIRHTSFRIGGCADIFIDASVTDVGTIVEICEKEGVPITVIGNGSNLLVGDKGIRGVTLALGGRASGIAQRGNTIEAGAGTLLSSISKAAMLESLSGMEFAGGIPGSLGGAICMNAGAYGGEIRDVLSFVEYYDFCLKKICKIPAKECDLSYRNSIFSGNIGIILQAFLTLTPGDHAEIVEKMKDFSARRKEKQPLELPSAGSTFKRPEGYFAGKLIEDSGLKGFKVGGAMVSEKHAGFVVNTGGATARDVKELIARVSEVVFDKTSVNLNPEVRFVGEF